MEIKTNRHWDSKQPRITVITPVFNRRQELERAINSVENQTFTDFEYIIVDDGSTVELNDVVTNLMDRVSFPVLFIKKENGGVHTARNIAIRHARGEMIVNIDSDDELKEDALEILINAWDSIPEDKKQHYREVCARCVDENGKELGSRFPNNINSLSQKKAARFIEKHPAERFGFWRADTLKNNPWPEEKGITFVTEDIVWQKLSKRYKSYYINDCVRIYHQDGNDSYSREKKMSTQSVLNNAWNYGFLLNHRKEYLYFGFKKYWKYLILFSVFKHILKTKKVDNKSVNLELKKDKVAYVFLWIPTKILSIYYRKKKVI